MESPLLTANPKLATILPNLERHRQQQAQAISLLEGSGNTTYRVDFADESIALRLNGETEHLGVDRLREKSVLDLLKRTNICPDVVEWNEFYLATTFVSNSTRAPLAAIARTLRQLHEIQIPAEHELISSWSPIDTLQNYLDQSTDHLPVMEDCIRQLLEVNWQSMKYAVCHIDLNPGNILLQSKSQNAVFIDWEYARYGPVAYDLAVFIETHQLSEAQVADFLDLYGLAHDHKEIGVNRFAYSLLEVLWLHITHPVAWPKDRVEALASNLDTQSDALSITTKGD
jgi:thiamine kinase-like enzyme